MVGMCAKWRETTTDSLPNCYNRYLVLHEASITALQKKKKQIVEHASPASILTSGERRDIAYMYWPQLTRLQSLIGQRFSLN